ncbi:MAG TPA: SHOCT domain-containing protein [Anaerolineales bacterium]|nr:SHOCT domain-containing protein [Anaerolineales bacterium]
MEKKNPLIAGLLNMVVPGLSYFYVGNDLRRFIKTLIGGIAAIVVLVLVGNAIQSRTDIPLSQGVCVGILLLIVLVPLFLSGQKIASQQNRMMDNASRYDSKQHGSAETQLAKNQALRDKGMISEQEYESRRNKISSKE